YKRWVEKLTGDERFAAMLEGVRAVSTAALLAVEKGRIDRLAGWRAPCRARRTRRTPGGWARPSFPRREPARADGAVPLLRGAVDRDGADACKELDAVLLAPGQAIEEDLARVLRAGDH